jgi:hypothetical protein
VSWPWDGRGFPRRDRLDSRVARSFTVAEGTSMPAVGDVLVFGATRWPAGCAPGGFTMAARVEGTMGRTVFYVPYPDDEVPLGASRWKLTRRRTSHRRYEEVASRV